MSDTFFVVCFAVLAIGLLGALIMIDNLIKKMRRLEEELGLTKLHVCILKKLYEGRR